MLEKCTEINSDLKYNDYTLFNQEYNRPDKVLINDIRHIINNIFNYKSILLELSCNSYPDTTLVLMEFIPFEINSNDYISLMCYFYEYINDGYNFKGFINNPNLNLEDDEERNLNKIMMYMFKLLEKSIKNYKTKDLKKTYILKDFKYICKDKTNLEEKFTVKLYYNLKEDDCHV